MNKPCRECPFQKTSAPGYLGNTSYRPEEFLVSMEHNPLPCHLTIDFDDPEADGLDLSKAQVCVGSLQFLKHTCKMPRDPKYNRLKDAVERNPEVFGMRSEFIEHHSKH